MSEHIINDEKDNVIGREYGVEKINEKDKNFKMLDYIWIFFAAGVNTGSWYFGGIFASLGLLGALAMGLIVSPLMMIPWAMLGVAAYKVGITTSGLTRLGLGIRGSVLPSVFQTFAMAGWAAVNTFIAAISLSFIFNILFGWIPYGTKGSTMNMIISIGFISITQAVIAVLGRNIIKYMEWVAGFCLIVLGILEAVAIFKHFDLNQIMSWKSLVPVMAVGIMIDGMFGFNWSWTQIGDFSRFSKNKTNASLGPWIGINLGQGWFFVVGSLGAIAVALQTGVFDPNVDPSSILEKLGLGVVSFSIVIFATINTNATNIYSSSMGILNITKKITPRKSLAVVAIVQFILCFVPLFYSSFLDFFMNFLNLTAGLFVPFWSIVLVDYFFIRKGKVSDEIFDEKEGGKYWYKNGFNMCGVYSLIIGVMCYYGILFFIPNLEAGISASLPCIAVTSIAYFILAQKAVKRGYIII